MRAVRHKRRLRQSDVARAAGVSRTTVWRLERGHLGELPLDTARRVAGVLDVRIDIMARWHGGDLDRLLNARHSAMHDLVARQLAGLPSWRSAAEVSYAIYGERGVIDILAWHEGRRALLVIELKTDIVDVQQLLGSLDQKRRLAPRIAVERGWPAGRVAASGWVVVADTRTNRARLAAHATVLRGAFPADGRTVPGWLAEPRVPLSALSFLQIARGVSASHDPAPILRVRSPAGR